MTEIGMSNQNTESSNLAGIGRKLLDHAKEADVSAKRGTVVELFPYIFGAHERLSARAIGRFLEKEQGIKLSPATITKALNDPKKYWNLFFDTIEPLLVIYEKMEPKERRENYLYDDKAFAKVEFPGRDVMRKILLNYEFARAIDDLREKWFAIDFATRLKARPYLAERFIGKVK